MYELHEQFQESLLLNSYWRLSGPHLLRIFWFQEIFARYVATQARGDLHLIRFEYPCVVKKCLFPKTSRYRMQDLLIKQLGSQGFDMLSRPLPFPSWSYSIRPTNRLSNIELVSPLSSSASYTRKKGGASFLCESEQSHVPSQENVNQRNSYTEVWGSTRCRISKENDAP